MKISYKVYTVVHKSTQNYYLISKFVSFFNSNLLCSSLTSKFQVIVTIQAYVHQQSILLITTSNIHAFSHYQIGWSANILLS